MTPHIVTREDAQHLPLRTRADRRRHALTAFGCSTYEILPGPSTASMEEAVTGEGVPVILCLCCGLRDPDHRAGNLRGSR